MDRPHDSIIPLGTHPSLALKPVPVLNGAMTMAGLTPQTAIVDPSHEGSLPFATTPTADTHLTALEVRKLCDAMTDSDPLAIDNQMVLDWTTDILFHLEMLLRSRKAGPHA